MNSLSNNGLPSKARGRESGSAGEDTLRLIASLPAPDGLADRVKAGLRRAPENGRMLMWRGPLGPAGGWMYSSVARGAAAAAIVCVVAGGGWRIYSHVQQVSPANVIVMPPPVAAPGGDFGSAKAHRVPDTLKGPELKHPVVDTPEVNVVEKVPAQPKAVQGGAAVKKKKPRSHSPVLPMQ